MRLKQYLYVVVGGNPDRSPHVFYAVSPKQADGFARAWSKTRGLQLERVKS